MNRSPFPTAGVVLGAGMGGFIDGILLHQILQTHSMLSALHAPDSLVNVEINMFWDGIFHAATWITTALGIALLWRGVRQEKEKHLPSTISFLGSLLFGWGLFNLVEGTINHHVLQVHHVVERLGLSAWDYGFLASGAVLMLLGWRLMHEKGATQRTATSRPVTVYQP